MSVPLRGPLASPCKVERGLSPELEPRLPVPCVSAAHCVVRSSLPLRVVARPRVRRYSPSRARAAPRLDRTPPCACFALTAQANAAPAERDITPLFSHHGPRVDSAMRRMKIHPAGSAHQRRGVLNLTAKEIANGHCIDDQTA